MEQLTPQRGHTFKIISGGQTGVDRAALDAAEEAGLAAGGWCPMGRIAEDGVIDRHYPLRETPSSNYSERTAWNVRDSEATLILHEGVITGGTSLARSVAAALGRRVLEIDVLAGDAVERIVTWVREEGIRSVNVAGARESEAPGIYLLARQVLAEAFKRIREDEERALST